MRLGVFSDVHANLEALEEVCRVGEKRGVEAWICLGDIVGYGADPAACVRRVRQLTPWAVLGNHDAAAVGLADLEYFNPYARRALEWTMERLAEEERRYLACLPLTLEQGQALYVHAEPGAPQEWGYVLDGWEVRQALAATSARLCFIGHSHCGFVCAERQGVLQRREASECAVELQPEVRYLVNVGSVGQPRDGDPRACFALWDPQEGVVELVRCPYDVAVAQRKIAAAGLPLFLAERLAQGR